MSWLQGRKRLPTDFSKVDFLVSNEANFEVLSKAKKENSGICNILITTLPIKEYAEELKHQEELLLDHIISINPVNNWDVEDLRVILQKNQKEDIFGIEKYLAPGTKIIEETITGSVDKEKLKVLRANVY